MFHIHYYTYGQGLDTQAKMSEMKKKVDFVEDLRRQLSSAALRLAGWLYCSQARSRTAPAAPSGAGYQGPAKLRGQGPSPWRWTSPTNSRP